MVVLYQQSCEYLTKFPFLDGPPFTHVILSTAGTYANISSSEKETLTISEHQNIRSLPEKTKGFSGMDQ